MHTNFIQKQEVFIYIEGFEHDCIDKKWEDQKYNPGIGGTTFQQLRLISELQENYKNLLQIFVLTDHTSGYILPNGLKTYTFDFLISNFKKDIILIINSGGCERYFELLRNLKIKKLLVWLHHPFDKKRCDSAKRLDAELVSCGLFQYFSNSVYIGRHSYVNNFFYEKEILLASKEKCYDKNILKSSENHINIGFLGNIREEKGFHVLAEYWNKISLSLRKLGYSPKLIVIGGHLNPLEGPKSSKLGIAEDYEKKLLNLFKNDMKIPEDVYFTGSVSNPYKYLNHLDLCVVNPLGIGEAASQTVLEIYSLSVPVVTSEKFGMCDYTDHIGEIATPNKAKFTEQVLNWFKKTAQEKEEIINKQLLISHLYSQTISLSAAKWLALILDNSEEYIRFSPIPKLKSLFFIPRELLNRFFRIEKIIYKFKKLISKVIFLIN